MANAHHPSFASLGHGRSYLPLRLGIQIAKLILKALDIVWFLESKILRRPTCDFFI